MAKKKTVLDRAFSTRELVMIIILVIILLGAFYYFMIVQGVSSTIEQNEQRLQTVQSEITTQQAIAAKRNDMAKELLAAASEENTTKIRKYDNFRREFNELDKILKSATTYNVSFGTPVATDTLVRREVSITYTANGYNAAYKIAKKVVNCGSRCLVTNLGFSQSSGVSDNSSPVSATLNVTFFETTEGVTDLSGLEIASE